MKNLGRIFIVSSSLGEYEDSHAIRILNYLPQGKKLSRVRLVGIGDGILDGLRVCDSMFRPRAQVNKGACKKYSFSWFRANISHKFVYPDQFKGWARYLNGRLAGELTANDILITASGSIEAHKFGLLAKEKHPDLVWIADFGDPWWITSKAINPLFGKWAKKDEQQILAGADVVLVTTQATKDLFLSSEPKANVHNIFYGYTEIVRKVQRGNESQSFHSGQIGAGYEGNRNLLPYLTALDSLDLKLRKEVTLAGPRSSSFDEYVKQSKSLKMFKQLERVDYSTSLEMLSGLDLFLIVGNKSSLQLPGKLFVALASDIPILYISQATNDAALDILKMFPGVLVSKENDVETIQEQLEIFFSKMEQINAAAGRRVKSSRLLEYSRKNNWDKLSSLFGQR